MITTPRARLSTVPPVRLPQSKTTIALLTACVLAGTACSKADTGLGSESADAITGKAKAAAAGAGAVHVQGVWKIQTQQFRIDLRLKRDGGVGTVVTADSTIELLRIGQDLYVRGDARLYQGRDGRGGADVEQSAQALRDKFVKVPASDPSYARLSGFTRMQDMITDLIRLNGKLKKDGREKVRGVETLKVVADRGRGGELRVALNGTPYPLKYIPSPSGGALELFEYDQDFPLVLPHADEVLDYGTLTDGKDPSGKPTGRPTDKPGGPVPGTD
ncbi:lipoprotein [Embleya hyalina]|uniref:Lipoprotein n=1 Tax=Embleya hyalina TaxID=516124 RepID=A0A401Z3R7_9ACTN|nr:lipoprotein [Embleya hyalina]